MLLLSETEPVMNVLQAPYSRLDSTFTELALWFSDSGHFPNVILTGLVFLLILISDKNLSSRIRWNRVICTVVITTALAGGGAWLNEYIIKENLKYPRPNIEYLAGQSGNGPLGMTAMEFYQGSAGQARTKSQRSDILQHVLNRQPAPVTLSTGVRDHWIMETGYSFPSGHSFAAMFFASFFLALGLSYLSGWRKYTFYLLIPWAVAVCYSRLILRVHTPLDITIGGLEGLVLGIGGFLLYRFIIKKHDLQV
jgi:phosphatidylglycerophosphatase B